MNTISLTTYSFNELSAKAKEKARDWYRTGLEFDHEPTYEDAEQCLAHCGFEIDRIYYTGFSSQGDGACFEGKWQAANVNAAAMRAHAPQDKELHRIADWLAQIAAEFPHASFTVRQSGHYYHQYCTDFNVSICTADGDEIDTPERTKAEEELIELARDAMQWIYRRLEADWDWQNADEQVDETICANDYAFTAEGRRSVTL